MCERTGTRGLRTPGLQHLLVATTQGHFPPTAPPPSVPAGGPPAASDMNYKAFTCLPTSYTELGDKPALCPWHCRGCEMTILWGHSCYPIAADVGYVQKGHSCSHKISIRAEPQTLTTLAVTVGQRPKPQELK